MKVQISNYLNPQILLNQRFLDKKKKPDLSSFACQKPMELVSRPDLAYHPSFNPSFGVLKKNQLSEYDLACANKFKAPLEKFNTNEDFNAWASKKLKEKTNLLQYKNEEPLIEKAVRRSLVEWKNYLYSDDLYKKNPAISLIIFDAITKDISPDTHAFPPELHKGVLSDTIGQVKELIKSDPKVSFDFNKKYQNNLRLEYTKDIEDNGDKNCKNHWVKMPSKNHDPANFEYNVKKLKALSNKTWCTRTTHADKYLAKGDFYIYLENNKPKVGVRLDGDQIVEIQGESTSESFPLSYIGTIKTFVSDNKLKGADEDIENAEKAKEQIKELHEKYSKDFKNNKFDGILNELGIKTKVLANGNLEVQNFHQLDNFTFEELGLDENDLFKHIEKISGDARFENCKVTDLGHLNSIGGAAKFYNSNVTDLGCLNSIGGAASFMYSKLTNLGNLTSIGGDTDFPFSKVTDLGKLSSIGGYANFYRCNVTNLSRLSSIAGAAYFDDAYVITGNVKYVGGNIYSGDIMTEDRRKLPFYKPVS